MAVTLEMLRRGPELPLEQCPALNYTWIANGSTGVIS